MTVNATGFSEAQETLVVWPICPRHGTPSTRRSAFDRLGARSPLPNVSAENEFGGPETGARSEPQRQELPAEETVFRVLIRLSDRKAEWIQRGTEKVSLPGLPGGGGVHLRTRLHPKNSLLAGNWQGISPGFEA